MAKLSFPAIVVIAANTMNGPGLTTLPSIATSAGKLTYTMLVIIAAAMAGFVCARLSRVMWAPHEPEAEGLETLLEGGQMVGKAKAHHHVENRPKLEERDIVALSDRLFNLKVVAASAMVGCALSLALTQMMLCAAIADSMLVASFGKSCGISTGIYCTSHLSMKPFETADYVPTSLVSAGLVIASSITINLATVDLDSMLTAQYFLFACLLVSCAQFCLTLYDMEGITGEFAGGEDILDVDIPARAPHWIGARPFDAVGPALFSFAFVVTAPPLVCGSNSMEGSARALVTACIFMGTLYVIVGSIGANAATGVEDDNLLSLVLKGTNPKQLNHVDIIAVCMFGLSQLAAIPVYCELARETIMTHLGLSQKRVAFVVCHVFPWTIVALTYNSALFASFVEWSSLLLLGFANFSLPLLLDYIHMQRALTLARSKLHLDENANCPSPVAWALGLITGSITAVIIERLIENLALSTFAFFGTTATILHLSRKTEHQ